MIFTHVKIPYYAYCLQRTGDNDAELMDYLCSKGFECWLTPCGYLYYKSEYVGTSGFPPKWWVREGENGKVKFIPPELFALQYKAING